MSKTDYKRLGDYIREVDVRNRDLKVTKPMGINIGKYFMPSVANIIGTDLSNYKVVCKNQFACNLMHVGRDEKIPIAVSYKNEIIIVSPAYLVFEIIDINLLLPQYLMMWFRRSEFDRNAWFYTDSDVRGGMSKSALLDMTLPIPPIERQREIVSEYETLSRRIELNNKMISRLEETAQTLYRKMFVDGIDKENLPDGWRMGTLGEIANFSYGKMPNKSSIGDIPIFSGYGIVGKTSELMYDKQHIIVIARGDAGSGKIVLSPDKFFLTNLAIAILLNDNNIISFLYYHLLNSDTSILRSGSAQAQVTINSLQNFEIIIPSSNYYNRFNYYIVPLNNHKHIIIKENDKLSYLQSILLAKMG